MTVACSLTVAKASGPCRMQPRVAVAQENTYAGHKKQFPTERRRAHSMQHSAQGRQVYALYTSMQQGKDKCVGVACMCETLREKAKTK